MRPYLIAAALCFATPVFAAGHGDLSDTIARLADAYTADPRVAAIDIDPTELSVNVTLKDGQTLKSFPDNIHGVLAQATSEAERDALIADFATTLITDMAASIATDTAPLDLDRLLPVVRDSRLGTGIGMPSPPSRPLFDRVSVFLVEDNPNSVAYVTQDKLDAAGQSFAKLESRAIQNLIARDVPLNITGDGIYLIIVDQFYESSYLLHQTLWDDIDDQLGTIVAVAPSRDIVVFVDADRQGAVAELRQLIAENAEAVQFPLSNDLLVWSDTGWTRYAEN